MLVPFRRMGLRLARQTHLHIHTSVHSPEATEPQTYCVANVSIDRVMRFFCNQTELETFITLQTKHGIFVWCGICNVGARRHLPI